MSDKINYRKLASEIELRRDTFGFFFIAKLLGSLYAFLFTLAVVYFIPLSIVTFLGYSETEVLNPYVIFVIGILVYFLITKPIIIKYTEIYFILSFILSCFVFCRDLYLANEWGNLFIAIVIVGFVNLFLYGVWVEDEKDS